jgi:spore coat protein CotH
LSCKRARAGLLAFVLLVAASSAAAQSANDVFNSDVLHDVQLRVNARDWNTLKRNFQLDTYYPAQFTWAGSTARDVAIRSRGFGSRNGAKPGLEIEFDRYRDGQRFAGLRSMTLDNHWQDPSMMRERISMLLFRRLGWPAPREAYARLWVNDEYVGLYSMVEDINEEFLEDHFGAGEDAAAGRAFVYEYRWQFRYLFEDLGRKLDNYEEIFDAKINGHRSAADLFGPIEEMIRTVNEASGDFASQVSAVLDVESVMTYLAIDTFLGDSDGFLGDFGVNNFYMVRLEGGRIDRFVPWDKDNAMNVGPAHPILQRFDENVLARKAIADPALRARVLAEFLRSADAADGWMEGEIARQFDRIREAAFGDPVKPFSNEQMTAAIEQLRQFARQRPAAVRAQVSGLR